MNDDLPGRGVNDPARLEALRATRLMDAEPADALERLARLASTLLKAPVALVSLVDDERQFFPACVGLPEPWSSLRQTPLTHSFCQYVVDSSRPLVVEDAREHPLVRDNLAVSELDVIAYAGIPLLSTSGQVLGSFCVADHERREWREEELATLADLAASVMTEIALRERVEQAESLAEELRESEELFRSTMNSAPIGTAIVGLDGRWIRVNRALCQITGYTEAQLLAGRWQDITHPDDLAMDMAQSERLLAGEIPRYEVEKRYIRPDGSVVTVLLTASVVCDAAGRPMRGIAQLQDVSARREISEALAASERRLAFALDAANDGLWDWNVAEGDAYFSPRWCTMLGYEPHEIEPHMRGWERLLHPDDRERVLVDVVEHFKGRTAAFQSEFRMLHKEGHWVWVLARGKVVERDAEGRAVRAVGTHTDVTGRREAEEAIRRSEAAAQEAHARALEGEARVRALLESTSEGIYGVDLDGKCTFVNRAAAESLGYSADELLGRDMHTLIHHTHEDGSPYPAGECPIVRAAQLGEVVRLDDERLWRQDGSWFSAEYSAAPLMRGGQIEGAVVTFLDITGRKRTEAERERLLRATEAARERVETALQARDDVLGVVAHDLRNPIGTIFTSASFLLEVPVGEEQRARQLEIIQRAARRADRLIQDLLDVARIEGGRLAVAAEPRTVGVIMAEAAEWAAPQAAAAGLELRIESTPATDALRVLADPDRVNQLFTNLVGNAVKFTPPGGRIRVRAEPLADAVRFEVSDTGSGISPDHLPHLFDRFWQANRTDRRGAGLGLAIVKGIVDAHGGETGAESTPGIGTTLWFTLPKG